MWVVNRFRRGLALLVFATPVLLTACQGSLQEKASMLSLSEEIPDPDTGGGLQEDEFIPLGISVRTVKDGDAYKGGTVKRISWTIRTDESYDELDPGFYVSQVRVSKDGGLTWETPVGGEAVPGASCGTQEECQNSGYISYDWSIPPSWEGDNFVVKIVGTNVFGQSSDSVNMPKFIIDNTAPVLTSGSLKINGLSSAIITRNPNVRISIDAIDALSPITEVCMKQGTPIDPDDTSAVADPCWIPLTAKGIQPSKTIALKGDDLTSSLGFIGGSFSFYVWLKDKAGNSTRLSASGDGTLGLDKQSVTFVPGLSVRFTKMAAGNNANFESPPTQSDLLIDDTHSSLFIRWGYEWVNGGSVTTAGPPIQLAYSVDGTNFTEITTAQEGQNGNCTFETTAKETGCYEWQNVPAALKASMFFVRVTVLDDSGYQYSQTSHPINTGAFRMVAGNTQVNLGGDASSVIFNVPGTGLYEADRFSDTTAIDDAGNAYVVDLSAGIVKVDSSTGKANVYLPLKGSSVDGFLHLPTTSISSVVRISMGYSPVTVKDVTIKNPLLIYESRRIRRVTLRVDPSDGQAKPYLETFIGANGITGNGTTLGNQSDRCIVYNSRGAMVTSFVTGNPRASCVLTQEEKALRYKIVFTATDPEKLNLNVGNNPNSTWVVLPNGMIYFLRAGANGFVKDYDLRVYKYDKTKKGYRVFPLVLTGKGTLKNCRTREPFSPAGCTQLLFNPVADFRIQNVGFSFDPTTSYVNSLSARMNLSVDTITDYYASNFNPYSGIANGTGSHFPALHNWFNYPFITSRRGQLHKIHHYDGSLYRINPSNATWQRVLGTAVWANGKTCPDGTPALACQVKLQDAFISSDNTLFFWDDYRLRSIDRNGNVATVFGQSRTAGDQVDPLIARIGDPEYISVWGADNRVVFLDRLSQTFREVVPGGSISTIAGSGVWQNVPFTYVNEETATTAKDLHLFYHGYWTNSFFAADPETGELMTTEFNNHRPSLIKLNRTNGKWTRVFGRYVNGKNSFFTTGTGSCDDAGPSNCNMVTLDASAYSPVLAGYAPSRVQDGQTYPSQLLILSHSNSANKHRRCFMKTYHPSVDKVQHFMGNEEPCYDADAAGSNDNRFPILSTGETLPFAASNQFPRIHRTMRMVYLPSHDGWLTAERDGTSIYLIKNYRDATKQYQVTKADTIELFRRTGVAIAAIGALYGDLTSPTVVYCSTSGGLYKIQNGAESQLMLPAGITCTGRSIEPSRDGRKVIFPIQHNGLRGIGEYEIF